jgi:hypothetical protein
VTLIEEPRASFSSSSITTVAISARSSSSSNVATAERGEKSPHGLWRRASPLASGSQNVPQERESDK